MCRSRRQPRTTSSGIRTSTAVSSSAVSSRRYRSNGGPKSRYGASSTSRRHPRPVRARRAGTRPAVLAAERRNGRRACPATPSVLRVVHGPHRRGVDPRDEHAHRSARTGAGPAPTPATTGTLATTTPGSESRRSLSDSSRGRRACSTSRLRERNTSGTTTVTKCDSPRGSRHTCSEDGLRRRRTADHRAPRAAAILPRAGTSEAGRQGRLEPRGRARRGSRRRDRAREPERLVGRRVNRLDETGRRVCAGVRRHPARAGAQPPRDPPVVLPPAHREHEHRHGHDH